MNGNPGRFPVSSIMLEDADTYEIDGGDVTLEQTQCIIDGEGSANDDLVNILPGEKVTKTGYQPLFILKAASGITITIKHGTGNISLRAGSDFSLTGEKSIMFSRMSDTDDWNDL